MKKPFRISEINLDNIIYSNPVVEDEKQNILLKYKHNYKRQQFIIQTPELICLSSPILKNNIYEINIDLQAKSSKKINNLLDFINRLDNKMEKLGENNNDWFNNKKGIYRKIIRDDSEHPNGILKLKVKKNNIPKYLKVTKNKQTETAILSDMKDGYKIKLVIDVFGLWIRKKNDIYYYGIYLKPVLIDYREDVEEISFIEDSDSDSDNINELLDTEYEQQYNNTETTIMDNIKNPEIDMKIFEKEDSICEPLIIDNSNKNKSELENANIMNEDDNQKKFKLDNLNTDSSIELENANMADASASASAELYSDEKTTNIIANYDNALSDTSSVGDINIDNFNLTT
jgi:hypothetical protein